MWGQVLEMECFEARAATVVVQLSKSHCQGYSNVAIDISMCPVEARQHYPVNKAEASSSFVVDAEY